MADSANDSSPGRMPDGPHPSPAVADPDSLTAEERRLREAREGYSVAGLGTLSQRTPVGDGPRGLQRQRGRLVVFQPRSGAVPRVPLGEDGIAGISDDKQRLCLAIALWNERDPILKERLFGLTNAEGDHGEDVEEYYFYVDNLPTHSYQRYLYSTRRPSSPTTSSSRSNGSRSRHEIEYELLDTGVF